MEEILHQLIGSISHLFLGFYTSQVVQDFLHQQYHPHVLQQLILTSPKPPGFQLSNGKTHWLLGYIGDYTTRLCGDYKIIIIRILVQEPVFHRKYPRCFFVALFFFSICLVCSLMIQIPQAIPMKPALYRKPFFLLRRTAQFHPLSMSNYINPTNMFKYCSKTCD